MIYLDYAATSPLREEALEAMLPYFKEAFGNPDSLHACGRRGYRPFMLGENSLVIFSVLRLHFPVYRTGKRRLAQSIQFLFKLVVITVKQKAQGSSPRGRVVNHLGHHAVVLPEVEFVSNSDFPRGVDQHIPNFQVTVQFPQQEHLDLRTGFLLISVQAGREHFRVIENEHVVLIKIIKDLLKYFMFYLTCLPVQHH